MARYESNIFLDGVFQGLTLMMTFYSFLIYFSVPGFTFAHIIVGLSPLLLAFILSKINWDVEEI